VTELVIRIAIGETDQLSGRHLSVHDDLDRLLARTEDVLSGDLYALRLRTLSGTEPDESAGATQGDRRRPACGDKR
jgi:hypothetical protein